MVDTLTLTSLFPLKGSVPVVEGTHASPGVTMSKSKAPLLIQWAEYGWARMRAFDYWNPGHLASHYPHKHYRNVSPGSAPTAEVPVSGSDRIFDIRYFDKDTRPKGAPDDPPSQLPVVGAFGKMTSNIPTGTPER